MNKRKFHHIKEIKGIRSLYGSFLCVTLIPLVIYGLVVTIYSSVSLVNDVEKEAENNLKNVSKTIEETYRIMYPGDFNVIIFNDEVELYKGDVNLDNEYDLLDSVHEETGLDISIFFYDTRLLTTIMDGNGNRYSGTGANPAIVNEVVANRRGMFYNNMVINNEIYYAYYLPVMSNDEKTCLGMVGVAESSDEVRAMAVKGIAKNIVIMLIATCLTGFIIVHFTSGIIFVIQRIMEFTGDIAKGNLATDLDPIVAGRSDELGELGRLIMTLRASLRRLIERDALTGIFNRRYAVNRLMEYKKTGVGFSVAMGDIDFFKKFNDTYGHECGDAVLKEVANTLRECISPHGFAARWGGEEFLLVFDNMDQNRAGEITEETLIKIRENKVEYEGEFHNVTMSFGVTGSDKDRTMDEDVNAADILLYEAKESGRNRVVYKKIGV